MDNAAVFIDGFNLYHGICDASLKQWLWVDLVQLARQLVPKAMHVSEVNYYYANARHGDSRARQGDFLEANREVNPGALKLVPGFLQEADCCTCRRCGITARRWQEKRTDVNMAVDIVAAAMAPTPRFDLALLVTGDADQVAAVDVVQAQGLKVLVRFPPARHSAHLSQAAGGSTFAYGITLNQLRKAQLPDHVVRTTTGRTITRPTDWGVR